MKKHLFHSFLSVVLFTAAITYLGMEGLLPMQEEFLNLLVVKLLIEVAILIVVLLGRAMFSRDAPQAAVAKGIPKKNSRPSISPAPSGTKGDLAPPAGLSKSAKPGGMLHRQPQKLALTAPAFFKESARLKNRPSERDRWLESVVGKQVTWHGTIVEVQKKDANMVMSMSVCSILENFIVIADLSLADLISSFEKGDFIKIEGVFEGTHAKPSIRAVSLNRLDEVFEPWT